MVINEFNIDAQIFLFTDLIFKVDLAVNNINDLRRSNLDYGIAQNTILHSLFLHAETGVIKVSL